MRSAELKTVATERKSIYFDRLFMLVPKGTSSHTAERSITMLSFFSKKTLRDIITEAGGGPADGGSFYYTGETKIVKKEGERAQSGQVAVSNGQRYLVVGGKLDDEVIPIN